MAKLSQSQIANAPLVGGYSVSSAFSKNSGIVHNPYTDESYQWSGGSKDSNSNLVNMYREAVLDKSAWDYQFNTENEYNLPSNQMARLQAAGLNPHLVYGGGATTESSSPSMPNFQHSDGTPLANLRMQLGNNFISQLTDILGYVQKGEMNEASVDQMRANTAYIQGKANLLNDEHALNMEHLRSAKSTNDLDDELTPLKIKLFHNQLESAGVDLKRKRYDYMAAAMSNYYAWQAAADQHTLNNDLHELNKLDQIIKGWSASLSEQNIDPRLDPKITTIHQNIMSIVDWCCDKLGITPEEFRNKYDSLFKKEKEEEKQKKFGIFSNFWDWIKK